MKELNEMTVEELDILSGNLIKEKERRKKLAKQTFDEKFRALSKIEDAFDEYYDKFKELPVVKCEACDPIQMNVTVSSYCDIPYLSFYPFYRK